jgi:HSP20 family protein
MRRAVALTYIKAFRRAWPMIACGPSRKQGHDMALGLADPFDALFPIPASAGATARQRLLENATSGVGAFPPINVFQQGSDFIAIIEMPGIDEDSIGLEVRGNAIRISGTKTIDYGSNASVLRRERVAGSFDRTISLPVKLDPDRVSAEYRGRHPCPPIAARRERQTKGNQD